MKTCNDWLEPSDRLVCVRLGETTMARPFVILALVLSTSAVNAGPKDEIIATDKAFSALSVARGSNAAFLAYMADDARVFGTGSER